jgi:hypothetical protein
MPKPGGDPSSGISSGDVLIRTERHPACRRREARPGFCMERENLHCVTAPDIDGALRRDKPQAAETARARVPTRRAGTEQPVVVLKVL